MAGIFLCTEYLDVRIENVIRVFFINSQMSV